MRFAARKAFARGLQPQISRRCTQEGSTHPQVGDIVVYTDSIAKQERTRLGHQQPESSDSKTRQLG